MKIQYENRWLAIRDEINAKGANGNAVVEALQDYYSIFEDKMLVWLAGLYEPDIGGFYFSESARDNETITFQGKVYDLLPDIESTSQATNFIKSEGVFDTWMDFPEWMRRGIEKFVCERQDPETGFFYHPQWSKEFTDSKPSRRSRDLTWAISIAKKFEFELPYPTALERMSSQKSDLKEQNNLPEYLLSEEKFLKHLKSLDWDNHAYSVGNDLSADGHLIARAGLGKVATDFLESIQNQKTGLWGKNDTGASATNAFMKISMFYRKVGRPLPNANKALPLVFERATDPVENTDSCVSQYNIFYSVCNIINDMRTFGGVEGNRLADEAIVNQLKMCIEPIRYTKEKALRFKKPEGCFSWTPYKTSGTSQGMPVAILGTNEGDINANGLCSAGTAGLLFEALGLHSIPIFSENCHDIFMSALKLPQK